MIVFSSMWGEEEVEMMVVRGELVRISSRGFGPNFDPAEGEEEMKIHRDDFKLVKVYI